MFDTTTLSPSEVEEVAMVQAGVDVESDATGEWAVVEYLAEEDEYLVEEARYYDTQRERLLGSF